MAAPENIKASMGGSREEFSGLAASFHEQVHGLIEDGVHIHELLEAGRIRIIHGPARLHHAGTGRIGRKGAGPGRPEAQAAEEQQAAQDTAAAKDIFGEHRRAWHASLRARARR